MFSWEVCEIPSLTVGVLLNEQAAINGRVTRQR